MIDGLHQHPTPRWLHWWAVGTVCATFVLLALGSIVTTFRVGMADPIWPTYPWHLLLISWAEPRPGFVIEHSHRAAGYIVGCLTIVLAAGLILGDQRRTLKWLGAAALAGVIVQGLIGGFRVLLHARMGIDLAMIHGTFAQLVFSCLVVIALLTSTTWMQLGQSAAAKSLRRVSIITVCLMFAQIAAGALLRHTFSPLGQRLHLLFAFVATAAAVWLLKSIYDSRERALRTPAWVLGGLLGLQIMLGMEAWLKRFNGVVPPELQHVSIAQAVTITAHVLNGFCLLATTVVISLVVFRLTRRSLDSTRSAGDLEAAA